jgi:lipopolysaccharide heptosyltransferase II
LGDVVMAIPGLQVHPAHVVVRAWLAPVLEMAGMTGRILPLEPGARGWARAVRDLRERRLRDGVLLTPSFSSAWLFRCGGVRRLRGTATDARGWLLTDRVPRLSLAGLHRVDGYRMLLGLAPGSQLRPLVITPDEARREAWRERLGPAPTAVGLFPGSHAPARRWPAERYAAVARALLSDGFRVVVVGGPGDREVTGRVAAAAPGVLDLGGATDLQDLAALLSNLQVLVTNDTGPMHLATAVGTRTVSVWGPSDPSETAPPGGGHRLVTGDALPCRPCRRNHCPRSGRGTMLPDAYEECMRLVDAGRVISAVHQILDGGGP